MSRQAGVGPSQRTHKEGRLLCPAMLKELAAREPPSSLPQPEIQPRVLNLLPQIPSSCPQGQSEADLSLLESPGVPSGCSPMAPGKPSKPQHPGSCRPSELLLSTSVHFCPYVLEAI